MSHKMDYKKHMSLTINNKLIFKDSFQFLGSSLDRLVLSLSKDYSKNLSQGSDNNILNPVRQKGFYPYEYVTDFKSKQLPSK